jgi:hypothetical protein
LDSNPGQDNHLDARRRIIAKGKVCQFHGGMVSKSQGPPAQASVEALRLRIFYLAAGMHRDRRFLYSQRDGAKFHRTSKAGSRAL